MLIRSSIQFMAMAACFVAALACGNDQPAIASSQRDLIFFLHRLRTLDALPELENSHTSMSSTWDRSGGNLDGWDFKHAENGTNVLFAAEGPGSVHRMFTGWLGEGKDVLGRPGPARTRIQIFLDHAERPLFDMPVEKFFDDRNGPFPYPLVFHKTYPGMLFPIPFRSHCRIQLVNTNAPNWGNFWQIACTKYEAPFAVKSLTWPLSNNEKQELQRVREAWLEAESRPPAAPAKWTISRELDIAPGKSGEVLLEGCGVVRQLRVHVWPPTPDLMRGLRLQARWDGATNPSVDVPLGYFFGNADYGYANEIHFNSLLLGVNPAESYACFPMPFATGAVFRIENRSSERVFKIRFSLDVERREKLPENWGRFHVTWTEKRAAEGDAPSFGPKKIPGHEVLRRECRGKYVGVLLHVQWPHQDWWGEGDWLIWTDEDGWPPRYHGTGTEEYFSSGWCQFDRKAVSGFVKTHPGEVSLYSFHLNDAFQFQQNIRIAVETFGMDGGGMTGDTIIHRDKPIWGTTAFWYAPVAQSAGSLPQLLPRK